MPFTLPLTDALRKVRWKVKIRDKETREPPHVTIIRGTKYWRIGLRDGAFMDDEPDPDEVPQQLLDLIAEPGNWQLLCEQWDELYPGNPVHDDEDAGDEEA